MIGVFVLLILIMFLVVKYCKKTLRKVLAAIILIITMYCVILSIDMNRIMSFREPIFARNIVSTDNEEKYKGFGYTIEIEKIEGKVMGATMYMFGKVIAGMIT